MLRVAIPLAGGGLGAAAALAFARGIGEFGATILFAGSFQGTTQTLPLAVYSLFDANLDQAIAIGVLLIVFSGAILLTAKLLAGSWPTSRSISRSRGERSILRRADARAETIAAGRPVRRRQDLAAAHRRRARAAPARPHHARRRGLVRRRTPASG